MSWFKVIKLSEKQKKIASKAGDKEKIDAEDFKALRDEKGEKDEWRNKRKKTGKRIEGG